MKTLSLVYAILVLNSFTLCGEELSISIVERSSRGESKQVASVHADDDATRKEFLELWQEASKAFPKDRRNLFGPDSGFVELNLVRGRKKITVRSWHPLYEKNPKLVVTSRGVEALEGRKRDEVLKTDEVWYQVARKCFDNVVSVVKKRAEDDTVQPTTAVESKSEGNQKPEPESEASPR